MAIENGSSGGIETSAMSGLLDRVNSSIASSGGSRVRIKGGMAVQQSLDTSHGILPASRKLGCGAE